jgi:hypothetical protein
VLNDNNEPIDVYPFKIETLNTCYALYINKRQWLEAKSDCENLTSNNMKLNARLVDISGVEEHQSILKRLIELQAGNPDMNIEAVEFGGPWTLGVRNFSKPDPLTPEAFSWGLNPLDPSNPSWNIFPSKGCESYECQKMFWGNAIVKGEGDQQPDSPSGGLYCVRYAISQSWNPTYNLESLGFPGLADDKCNEGRPYICEWSSL